MPTSIWRPWLGLRLHAAAVAVAVVAAMVATAIPRGMGSLISDAATSLLIVLALFAPLLPAVNQAVPPLSAVAWLSVVPVYLLALHWSAGAAIRRSARVGAVVPVPGRGSASSPRGVAVRIVAVVLLGAGVGAGCWLGWLAAPQALGLYAPEGAGALPWPALAQAAAVATALVAAVVMIAVTRCLAAAPGVGAGLWLAHTIWALGQDSALWAFASALAMLAGGAVAALAVTVSLATGTTRMAPAGTPEPALR